MRRLALAALLALAAAAPEQPGVNGSAARVTVDPAAPPWRSLARLQVAGESRCTAVMIGLRLALTAGHCLYGRRLGHDVPAESVHVLTDYANGSYTRHSIAASYQRLADGADVALVTLADPIGTDVLRLATADPPVGAPVMLGGYNQDRDEVIEADRHCHVRGALQGRLIHDCAATFGTSGAPLLGRAADGTWRIVGLQVGAFTERTGGVAIPASRLRHLPPPPN